MEIKTTDNGGLEAPHNWFKYLPETQTVLISPEATVALKAYFEHENDEELGRWRDPEDATVLVYDQDGVLVVVDEAEASLVVLSGRSKWHPSINRYVSAQESWQSAEPGEVWLITALGKKPEPMIATTYGTFTAELSEYTLNDETIITGSRIYPEKDGDNDE